MTDAIKQRIEQINKGEIPNGYSQTKAGVFPDDWKCIHINQLAEKIIDKVGNETYETLSISAGIGFVNQAKKFGKELSGKQYEKYTVLKRGDFSYNKGNSKTYPQGCIYRLKDRDRAAVPNVFESFTIKNGNSDYYEQLFLSGFLNKQLSTKINHGVRDDGLLNLTGKDFYSCSLPSPPLEEQQRIAEVLMQCDKVIKLYEQEGDELKKLKKAYLRKMFPQKGKNIPELRFAGFTDPWEHRKLGEISKTTIGEFVIRTKQNTNSQYPVYNGGTSYTGFYDDFNNEGNKILVSARGTNAGYVNIVKTRYWAGNSCYSIDLLDKSCFDIDFIYQEMKRNQLNFIKNQQAANIPSVSKADVERFEIAKPSYEEQTKIATFFKHLDHLIALHQRKLEEQQKQKKSLMQLLLTGIVRVKI